MKRSLLTCLRAVGPALAACALLAVPASAQGQPPAQPQQDSPGAITERWDSLRHDAGGLIGNLFGHSDRAGGDHAVPAATGSVGAHRTVVAQGDDADVMTRLDRLENQLRQLTGSIEQLQFRNQQLEQQVRRSQEDTEYRFQELGAKAPRGRTQPVGQPPAVGPGPLPGRRSDVFDPHEDPNAPGAPRRLGSLTTPSAGPSPAAVEDPGIGAPGGRAAGAPLDLSTLADHAVNDPSLSPANRGATVAAMPGPPSVGPLPPPPPRNPNATGAAPQLVALPPGATARDEFAVAHGYLQHKDYALAEESFRDFLKKYPNDRLAADAHYWLGESLFQRQRYRDAAESFLNVSTKFDKSSKASEALLRLGQSLAALNEKEAACATLGEVLRKYPNAPGGVKQGVEREQKRTKC
jgi:tol-pal system protein YbgF